MKINKLFGGRGEYGEIASVVRLFNIGKGLTTEYLSESNFSRSASSAFWQNMSISLSIFVRHMVLKSSSSCLPTLVFIFSFEESIDLHHTERLPAFLTSDSDRKRSLLLRFIIKFIRLDHCSNSLINCPGFWKHEKKTPF